MRTPALFRHTLLLASLISTVQFAQTTRVSSIDFEGNERLSDGRLKSAIRTQEKPFLNSILFWRDDPVFQEEVFLNDLLRVEKFYFTEGYLDARVVDYRLDFNEGRKTVQIYVTVDEGPVVQVSAVRFIYPDSTGAPLAESALREKIILKNGATYRENDLRTDYSSLTSHFSNNGYPYIKARVRPLRNDSLHTVRLDWLLTPGPKCVFGDITVTGNANVSESVIRDGLGFKEGNLFRQYRLENAQSNIYRLEAFQYVNLQARELRKRRKEIPVDIRIQERKIRTLKLGAGYGSEEGFRSSATWKHRNFLGGSRILTAELRHANKTLPLNAELKLSQPFFLDELNDLIVAPFFTWQDEESYEARRLGFTATFSRRLDRYTNQFITTRIERDSIQVKGVIEDPELEEWYNKSILGYGIVRNTIDQLFTPTRGSIASLNVEEAGLLLQSAFRYVRLSIELRGYHTLYPGFVLAGRAFAGSMRPWRGSTVTPVEERFYSGGSYSVRGWGRHQLGPKVFDENLEGLVPAGGNSTFEGGLELRYPVHREFTGAMFLDFGNVWEAWDGYRPGDLHYAAGVGFRYNTPIGPLRVDLAWKLNQQPSDDQRFQIHFSIGNAY